MADIIDFAFFKQYNIILFAHRSSFVKRKTRKLAKEIEQCVFV